MKDFNLNDISNEVVGNIDKNINNQDIYCRPFIDMDIDWDRILMLIEEYNNKSEYKSKGKRR